MHYIRIVWRSIRLIQHLLVGCFLVPFSLKRDQLGVKRVRPRIASWWYGRLMRILGFRVVCTGQVPTSQALLVANHVSWVDIPLLGHLTAARFLAKDDVRHWPLIGWFATVTGALFIKRGGGQTGELITAMHQQLQIGGMLALFPEGTTTDGREVRPFFPRLFAAVTDSEIPIVPVTIHYHINGAYDPLAPFVGDQSLGGNLLGLLGRKINQVDVRFLEPVVHQGQNRKVLAGNARHAIVEALDAIRFSHNGNTG